MQRGSELLKDLSDIMDYHPSTLPVFTGIQELAYILLSVQPVSFIVLLATDGNYLEPGV